MPSTRLYDVATRFAGKQVLAVADAQPAFKVLGTAHLFQLSDSACISTFPVRYERPGFRAALSRDNAMCFLGCYDTYGLAAYSVSDGGELWRRKDLKAVQTVAASEVEDLIFCGRGGAAHLLNAKSGETIARLPGAKSMYFSPFDKSVVVVARSIELHRPFGTNITSFKRTQRFALDCAFSRSEVLISEPASLRCCDKATGELLWTYAPSGDLHASCLCFNEQLQAFAAVERHRRVLFFQSRKGDLIKEVALSQKVGLVYDFCLEGAAIINCDLRLYSSIDGSLLRDLALAQPQDIFSHDTKKSGTQPPKD